MGLQKPKPQADRVDMHIYVTRQMFRDLTKLATAADRSVTAEVRRALRFYLEEAPNASDVMRRIRGESA